MTFLELCQEVARESGTVPNIGDPQTVTSQAGRLARIVSWTSTAWQMIQNNEPDWRWMNAEFSAETVADVQEYAADGMGISERFGHWLYRNEGSDNLFSFYKTSEGQNTEGLCSYIEWEKFRRLNMVGGATSTTGSPIYVSVGDNDRLYFYPIPDAAYTVRGRYHKSPQILTSDTDVPEMPAEFHRAIVYRALMLLAEFDESGTQMPTWKYEFDLIMDRLRNHQLPRITTAGTLA